MCGIGGFVDYKRNARHFLPAAQRMKRTLTPRGPDAEGGFSSPDALLVHRRLIVIDPNGGRQPMYSPDGNTILIYNGELYNTEDIRSDLVAARAPISPATRTPKCCCMRFSSGERTHFRASTAFSPLPSGRRPSGG